MMRRITKENTSTIPWCDFVGDSGGGVEVAKKTKNKKRRVVEMRVMKEKIWSGSANGFGG
jgi:hypothetical protein